MNLPTKMGQTKRTPKEHFLVLTGIANGVPDFSLLTLTQDGSLGFTMQDLIEGQ